MSRSRPTTGLEGLDRESWQRIDALLDSALELAGDERSAFLDRACAGDPGLRARVDMLLAADAVSGSLLDRPVLDSVPGLLEEDEGRETRAKVDRVGSWRILREIGRGGMGVVYLAERADGQFEQRVALKLIKRGLDTDEIVGRFQQERQILARLEHPHIARLVDGGVTDEGLPYIAMEYVEGVPLTEHCRSRGLGLDAALRLFDQVCEAVQYAHRNLVVHRDLKPGNIMVSEGAVKLLDFGIAKVLAPGGGEAAKTMTMAPRLTPDYAAPEQLRGEPPTTATDVYALGVVLYELLTGGRPHRRRDTTHAGAENATLDEEPEPPSTAAARRGREARARAGPVPGEATAGPGAWRGRLKGDLDDIVLMALRNEPERRYPSVEALRDDLTRWRAGRPVRATRPTWGYRAGKFVRRNRAAVTAGALVALSIVAGLIGTTWQAHVAARERDRALLEARKASEIKDFALGLFQVSDPEQSRGANITARELLERGAGRVERELKGQPAVQAEMLDLIGGVYYQLSEYARAESVLVRATELGRRTLGREHVQVAHSLSRLGQVLDAEARYDAAIAALREALAIQQRQPGERRAEVAATLSNLAATYDHAGRPDSAEALHSRALAIDRALFGEESANVATDLDNLGVVLQARQRPADAVPLLRRALEIRRRVLGSEHPATATVAENLALALQNLGRTGEAVRLHEEALRIRRKILDPMHLDIAHTLGNFANLKRDQGDHAGAASMYEEALAIERHALGSDHPDVARSTNNLAILYYQRHEFERALQHFREAFESFRRVHGGQHPGTLNMEGNIGAVLRAMGRYQESERVLAGVLARRRSILGEDDADVANSYHNLGVLHHLVGRDDIAESELRRALEMRGRLLGDSTAPVAQSAEALAGLLRDQGRHGESLPLYRRAVAIDARVFPKPSPQSAEAFVGIGRLLVLMGRPREAEPYLRDALAVRSAAFGAQDGRTAEAAVALGLCRAAQGAGDSADSLIAPGLPVLRRQPGRPDPLIARAEQVLARGRSLARDR
ncbi:MAG: serine/threonine protein kinase [Candidatus Eisenbacteria bacterium]|nr:serine/threonine protein kinase [Candidatus Eisenbacteria bacterium]